MRQTDGMSCSLAQCRVGPKKKAAGISLHIHSAGSHLMAQKFGDSGINRLSYPPHSFDFAFCDFWLVDYLKNMFERSFFDDSEECVLAIEEAFADRNIG
jgi:hypothetical protein